MKDHIKIWTKSTEKVKIHPQRPNPASLGMNSSMFTNCSVFCDVRHVQSSVLGQNVMFGSVRSSVQLLCDQTSLGTYSLMFTNCSVFCDVRHVQSSILGPNVMFGKFNVWTFNVRSVWSSVYSIIKQRARKFRKVLAKKLVNMVDKSRENLARFTFFLISQSREIRNARFARLRWGPKCLFWKSKSVLLLKNYNKKWKKYF